MIRKTIIASICVLFLCCTHKKKYPSPFNLDEPPFLQESEKENSLNKDNKIYKSNRNFVFNYTIYDKSNKKLRSVVKFNEECFKDSTINCNDWELIAFDEIYDKNKIYPIDKINLYVYRTTGYNSLSSEQTLIKYGYYNNKKGRILFDEQTGIVEDSSTVFIHPPREHSFIITELSPFPRVDLPLFVGKKWTGNISIHDNTMRRTRIGHSSSTSFQSFYEVKDTLSMNTLFKENVYCYHVFSENHGDLGKSSLDFYFSPEYGFIKMNYINIDSTQLSLELVGVKEN